MRLTFIFGEGVLRRSLSEEVATAFHNVKLNLVNLSVYLVEVYAGLT